MAIKDKRRLAALYEKATILQHTLQDVVQSNPADALLLGGFDSALLNALDPQVPAITVILHGQGLDAPYAQESVEFFGTPWHLIEVSFDEALADLGKIMSLANSYDIGMKNDIPMYEGMMYAASLGYRILRTGDAADEIYAGYSYFYYKKASEIRQILDIAVPEIRLSSSRLSRALGLHTQFPYLDERIWKTSLTFSKRDLITALEGGLVGDVYQEIEQFHPKSKLWGKIVLRVAAESIMPKRIAWRQKASLEYGSGFYKLEPFLEASCTRGDIEAMVSSGKSFWSHAHGKLYLQYRSLGLMPPIPNEGEYPCSWCGGGIILGRNHCLTCGAWPANKGLGRTFEREYHS